MIKLYLLTIETVNGPRTCVIHNIPGKNIKEQIEKVKNVLKEIYGDDITFKLEEDVGHKYIKEHYPDHYDGLIASAKSHFAKYN